MESLLSFPTAILATISVTLLAFLYHLLIHTSKPTNEKSENYKQAPRAPGAWPILGHLHLFGEGAKLPHKVLGKMADKCGPIFTIKIGVHEALVVNDSEMAKECLMTNDKVFVTRPKSVAGEVMGYNYAMFSFGPYGPYWRQMRKISALELLSQRRLDMLAHIRVSEVYSSIRDTYKACKGAKNSVVKMEMKHWFSSLILNVNLRMIIGKRFLPGDEEGIRFEGALGRFFKSVGAFVLSDAVPSLRWLDLGGGEKTMRAISKEMDEIVEGWLKEHKKKKASEPPVNGEQQVFMDVMIDTLQGTSKEDLAGYDRDTIIKATCLTILTAATDTTEATLSWAMSLLINNPEKMKKAQQELDIHIGGDRVVQESDLSNLVYLQAIIKETLRLYPAGPMSAPHMCMEDCTVGGYNVTKGTYLLTNIWKIHHDPNVWSDPFEFRPERFLTSHKDIDIKGQHFELIPFGSGRRICPGISFGILFVQFALASVLHAFNFQNPSVEPIDMTESFGLTNLKATPIDVLLTPRQSHNLFK